MTMRRTTLIAAATVSIFAFSSWKSSSGNVFICDNGKTEVYHLDKECHGLKRCTTGITPLTLKEAKDKGLRLCGYEESFIRK